MVGLQHRLGLATLTLLLGTSICHAQLNPFRSGRQSQGLTKADVSLLSATAGQLNETSPLHVGDKKSWTNPDSGDSGDVRVMRIFNAGGCHTLRYDLVFKARAAGSTYTVNWCRTDAGWKVKS